MKTIRDWNAYVVQRRAAGVRIDLASIIVDYVTRYQRVKWVDIVSYVYKSIGEDYRSKDFDAYIAKTVSRLEKERKLQLDGSYYRMGE